MNTNTTPTSIDNKLVVPRSMNEDVPLDEKEKEK